MMSWLAQTRVRLGGLRAVPAGQAEALSGRRATRWASDDLFPGVVRRPERIGLSALIRSVLDGRNAVGLSELSDRLGLTPERVRNRLEGMIVADEVERLRPVRYGGWDRDFFRLKRASDRACLWQQRILAQGGRTHVPV